MHECTSVQCLTTLIFQLKSGFIRYCINTSTLLYQKFLSVLLYARSTTVTSFFHVAYSTGSCNRKQNCKTVTNKITEISLNVFFRLCTLILWLNISFCLITLSYIWMKIAWCPHENYDVDLDINACRARI